jgi:hypothetical protein
MLYATVCDRLRLAAKSQKTDSKSAGAYPPWGFKSSSGHQKIFSGLLRSVLGEVRGPKSYDGSGYRHNESETTFQKSRRFNPLTSFFATRIDWNPDHENSNMQTPKDCARRNSLNKERLTIRTVRVTLHCKVNRYG